MDLSLIFTLKHNVIEENTIKLPVRLQIAACRQEGEPELQKEPLCPLLQCDMYHSPPSARQS